MKKIFMAESTQKLSPKTVKAVLLCEGISPRPLGMAFGNLRRTHLNGMTENNCYSGNHIQKEIALNKIAENTEHLFSPILKKLSSDAVYVIKTERVKT